MDEQSIFTAAVEIEDATAREAFLKRACGGDTSIRHRVEELLRVHAQAGSFLDAPAAGSPETEDRPISEAPGTMIGPYKLLQQIGEGGMGVVFMAQQETPVERRVAMKIIKPGMDTKQVIARFEAERQALAMMDHPNIAKVLDAGTTQTGRPYFVMELVNGIPVTQFCNEQRLTARERLELFVPICRAVQHAHHKGIIHRDIKPSNILVALYDSHPVPKVIDFGVAKAVSQRLTEKTMFTALGQIIGTVEYMSPEQAQRNQLDIDTRSDVYSLGVVLYELLTGETPFDKQRLRSAAIDELLRIIREEEPPRPSIRLSKSNTQPSMAANLRTEPTKLSALIRGELDWIVMKVLEKDRARRYETPTSLAADVEHFLHDEPVTACPPSTAYRLHKFARRNKTAIAAAGIVVISLVLGLLGTTTQAVRARRAEREAVAQRERAEETQQEAVVNAARYRSVLTDFEDELTERAIDAAFSGDLKQTRVAIDKARLVGAAPDLLRTLEGLALLFDGKEEEAVESLQKVAADYRSSFLAYSALWCAYRYSADYGDMHYVQKVIVDRGLIPKDDYDRLFYHLMQIQLVPAEELDDVMSSLDQLIDSHPRWGAAYAVRAVAWEEIGKEFGRLEDLRMAIKDIETARSIVTDSPLILTIALYMIIDGIEIAEAQNNVHDYESWVNSGEEIRQKLRRRPECSMGKREVTVFRHVTGQEPLSSEMIGEDELIQQNKGGCCVETAKWLREGHSVELRNLELKLRQKPNDVEALLSLCLILVEQSEDGRRQAMDVFWKIQDMDVMPISKVFALHIPLLLGQPDEARKISQRLLDSGALSHEWRAVKYMAQYHAGRLAEEELLERAGPFGDFQCDCYHEIALEALARGDREKALTCFRRSIATGQVATWGYHIAQIYQEHLESDARWPDWIDVQEHSAAPDN